MNQVLLTIILILVLVVTNVRADFWSSSVGTNTSSWSIYRQSSDIDFNLSGAVEGNITPIDVNGRVLSPHQSSYAEVTANDVRLRQRMSALEGSYRSVDSIRLWSNIDTAVITDFIKPPGTKVFTFSYYEQWPSSLSVTRNVEYSGRQINERDFEGNNLDFAGSNLLYNSELSKEQTTIMWLNRMNATVQATDDAIIGAEFMPTKYLGYLIRTHTTGIADFKYRFTSPNYDIKRRNYPALAEGDERYYGDYNLGRRIEMKSVFENSGNDTSPEDWLPCYHADLFDMSPQNWIGNNNAVEIFNCTCNYRF